MQAKASTLGILITHNDNSFILQAFDSEKVLYASIFIDH